MLHQVLQALKSAQGPIDLRQMASDLDLEPSALQGMIDFWVRKGRIKDDSQATGPSCGGCASSSPDCSSGCSFVMLQKPRSYTLRLMDEGEVG